MPSGLLAPTNGTFGAPGVFLAPPEPVREITGVSRSTAAFFGVSPRGPARLPAGTLEPDDDVLSWLTATPVRRTVPRLVTSWDEYRHHFGGFEGPGRLPYAVSAFFAGGGRRAWIGRIVHDYGSDADNGGGRAIGELDGLGVGADRCPIILMARSEGRWGDRLAGSLRLVTRPLTLTEPATTTELVVDRREWVPVGSLLRLAGGGDSHEFSYVDDSSLRLRDDGAGSVRVVTLASAAGSVPGGAEVVTAVLEVIDRDERIDRREVIDGIGLRWDHPRWLGRVLINESSMIWPHDSWLAAAVDLTGLELRSHPLISLRPRPAGDPCGITLDTGPEPPVDHMTGGVDRWPDIVPEDFHDGRWVPGNEVPGDGVQSLGDHDDVGLVLVPDLYEPSPLVETDETEEPATLCGPDFDYHVDAVEPPEPEPAPPGLDGLRLDINDDLQRDRLIENQQAIVAWADHRRDLTVLLDVPLDMTQRQTVMWRNHFDSPYVAAYHPWIDTSTPDDHRDALIRVNPSAFAAAIIAEREQRLGVQVGPANQIAAGALRLDRTITGPQHDELHRAGINVFAAERDGIRLTGARTMSRRSILRQLSVARLMAVLRLSIEREMQWAVFEPSNPTLWAEIRRLVHGFLSRLYTAGAFAGATTKEAFFVRCDRTTMTQNDIDNGRLICLVGVAPVEPIEYIVIELALEANQTVSVEVVG